MPDPIPPDHPAVEKALREWNGVAGVGPLWPHSWGADRMAAALTAAIPLLTDEPAALPNLDDLVDKITDRLEAVVRHVVIDVTVTLARQIVAWADEQGEQ